MHTFDLYTPGFSTKKMVDQKQKHQLVAVPSPLRAMPVSFAPQRNFGDPKIQRCPKDLGHCRPPSPSIHGV